MTVRNITEYENYGDAVSPNDLPPPPISLMARNHTEQAASYPAPVIMSQRNANTSSLPTSPVHVPALPNLSSPTDSYDSGALGKVRFIMMYGFETLDSREINLIFFLFLGAVTGTINKHILACLNITFYCCKKIEYFLNKLFNE